MMKLKDLFKLIKSNWGMDKWAHLGIGGLICAAITIPMILQELTLFIERPFFMLLVPAAVSIIVFVASCIKEKVMDPEFSWLDIVAAMIGCLIVELTVLFGAFAYYMGLR